MNAIGAVIGAALGLGAGYLLFRGGGSCGCSPPAMSGLGRIPCVCRWYSQRGTLVQYQVCSGDC